MGICKKLIAFAVTSLVILTPISGFAYGVSSYHDGHAISRYLNDPEMNRIIGTGGSSKERTIKGYAHRYENGALTNQWPPSEWYIWAELSGDAQGKYAVKEHGFFSMKVSTGNYTVTVIAERKSNIYPKRLKGSEQVFFPQAGGPKVKEVHITCMPF